MFLRRKVTSMLVMILAGSFSIHSCLAAVQDQKAETTAIRKIGSIQSINGNAITLKSDTGDAVTITIAGDARMLRIAPGKRDLKEAVPLTLQELQLGDRVLVGCKAGQDGALLAESVVVIKKDDIAQKQARDREDWQKRGIGGIVKSVDAANGVIVIAVTPSYEMTLRTTKATGFLQYSQDSIRFADSRPSSLEDIKIKDQLRARGTRNEAKKEFTAEQVIFGSFENIAGLISSVDAAKGSLTVKDVLSKKTVTVKVTPESHLQILPPALAQRIASLLRAPGAVTGAAKQGVATPEKAPPPPDLQQVLAKAQPVALADLKTGTAVIIVSTSGSSWTTITLLSGVEPVLSATGDPRAAAALSQWNLTALLADPTP